jgi:hypothetical protein
MSQVKQVKTPKGELEWVTISGEGKENMSGKMKYEANIVLDPENEEHAKFLADIDTYWAENKPAKFKKDAKSTGVYPHKVKTNETDEDGKPIYEETGKVSLRFQTDTTYPSGDAKVVKTYNAKGKEVSLGETKVGNGSIGRIAGAMGIYTNTSPKGAILDAGVTLYLNAIQISKLEEFASDAGFEADDDEDGWTGEDDSFEGVGSDDAPQAGPRL